MDPRKVTLGKGLVWRGGLILIIMFALALRLYRLDAQSLWADEGTSVATAGRDLTAITQGAARDIHPPLYYYLLHFWVRIFGTSEVAVRSLSALTGTALVYLTYLLGRRLFGPQSGVVAAFLSAISPFQVHYGQETRMYILVALLGALSVYLVLWIVDKETSRQVDKASSLVCLSTYLLVTALALYTHYFAFTILLVENVAYGLWFMADGRWRMADGLAKGVMRWVVLQLCIVALYLPWLWFAREQLRAWPAISEPFDLLTLFKRVLTIFSLGLSIDATKVWPMVIGFGVIFGLGVIPARGNKGGQGETRGEKGGFALGLALLYFVVPALTMYVLSRQRPMYRPKLLLLATPGYHLILARGIIAPSRRILTFHASRFTSLLSGLWLIVSLLFITAASARSLHNYYFDKRYARDDYREIARYIEAVSSPEDAILLNAPGQLEIFSYYYKGDLDIYPLPQQRPLNWDVTWRELKAIVTAHDRLFALLWATDESDPGRYIEGWLDEHAYKTSDTWYGNVRLVLYALPQALESVEVQHHLEIDLGHQVMLRGYSLGADEVTAGGILPLTLFWQGLTEIEERYKVFVHLLDRHDHIVGQRDAEPGGGAKITTTWRVGEIIVDNYGILVLPGTPPGEYYLEAGMYSLDTGERLPVFEGEEPIGDRILLESVRVRKAETPPPLEILAMRHETRVGCGQVQLLGYDLSKLGYEHQPDAPLHPGDTLHLTLYWQAQEKPSTDMELTLQLVSEDSKAWATRRGGLVEGEYPPMLWEVGEIVRDQYNLLIPSDAPSGRYRLTLQVRVLPEGRLLLPLLELGPVAIE